MARSSAWPWSRGWTEREPHDRAFGRRPPRPLIAKPSISTLAVHSRATACSTAGPVSHDAIVRDKPQDKINPEKSQSALSDTSEPQGQQFAYATMYRSTALNST
jgi:hypothetical protein